MNLERKTAYQIDVDGGNESNFLSVMKVNPKLTAHTVESLLEGTKRGWTLTANSHNVKEILRGVKESTGGYHLIGSGARKYEKSQGDRKTVEDGEGNIIETVAIWVIDPKGSAEIMSTDYVSPPLPPSTSSGNGCNDLGPV